jgi:scyllo-inositol 2-dehydrogenase (NADP+)
MNQKLRTAVVGLGRVGWQFHFKQSVASDQFDLCAVVDPLPDRLAEAHQESGCKGYSDIRALLDSEDLDVVAIASPTTLHEEMTCAAIEKGCHVILEKPMTTSLDSADRMIACAKEHGLQIFVYQPHRLTSETQTARKVIQSGLLGKIYAVRRAVYRYVRRNDWQSLRKNGGGMLNNYGAHYIDQMMYLSDRSPIVDVHCHLWAVATRGDADDVVKVWIQNESGQLLDIEINQASAFSLQGWHICGEYGTAVREGDVFKLQYFDPSVAAELPIVEGAAPGRSYDNQDRLPWQTKDIDIAKDSALDFYANVYDAIVNDAEPHIHIDESRELMRVLDLCRQSSKF